MVLTESSRSYSINISIPSQNECKKLTVSEHDLIQGIKDKIIREIKKPEESDNFTNNGLLLVSKKKDLKQFLNDKDEIGDLKKFASVNINNSFINNNLITIINKITGY